MTFPIKTLCFVSRICFLLPATRCVVPAIPRYHRGETFSISTGGSPYLSEEFQFRTTVNKDSRSNPRNLHPYNRLHFAVAYQESFCCCGSVHFGIRIRLTYERFRYDVYFSTASAYLSTAVRFQLYTRVSVSDTIIGVEIIVTDT